MESQTKAAKETSLTKQRVIDAARGHIRRYGEAKTNVVDIARALGTSHTTIYRHFRTKAEVFDAIAAEAMRDEQDLADTFVRATDQSASERLTGLVVSLHQRKVDRFKNDPEVYGLYRRVVEERPEIVRNYAEAMTRLVAAILADGVQKGEFKIDDVPAAAGVVRDAVTVFIHPAHVETAIKAGYSRDQDIRRVLATLIVAFRHGVKLLNKANPA